jgi:hypothetical protein
MQEQVEILAGTQSTIYVSFWELDRLSFSAPTAQCYPIFNLCENSQMPDLRKFLAAIATVILFCSLCWGWGRDGHRIIATVAEDHLNETTKVMIQSLIGNNRLYSVASWADDIRRELRDTAPWHYVNIPLGSKYAASRNCPPPRSCVVEKIADFIKCSRTMRRLGNNGQRH